MQPGPTVSLKCSASGNPTPKIVWLLDGFPLPNVSKFNATKLFPIGIESISRDNFAHLYNINASSFRWIVL